jgi:tetratricopeptide (TPR) repeat protein
MAGDPECAVEIYEAASSEDPFDPELRNNLGFCRLPGDTEAALADLEAAARLFGKPFGVNSANRMLAYFRLDRYDRVLELGEEFFLTGTPPGSAWLWEVDASAELRNDVDVMLYIIDLAERSAALAGRDDEAQKWRNRRLAWKPEGGQ